jgi:hypothetical protein
VYDTKAESMRQVIESTAATIEEVENIATARRSRAEKKHATKCAKLEAKVVYTRTLTPDKVKKVLARREKRVENLTGKVTALTERSHARFAAVMAKTPPPRAKHIWTLWECQLRCLRNKSHRCVWPDEILKWCCNIWRKDRGAYELMWGGEVAMLPHPDRVRQVCAATYDKPGRNRDRSARRAHSNRTCKDCAGAYPTHPVPSLFRYATIGQEARIRLESDQQRDMVLKADEINIRGDLVWKQRDGEYDLFGFREVITGSRLALPGATTKAAKGDIEEGKQLADCLATHAYCFQIECPDADVDGFRFVCAVYSVRDLKAPDIHHLVWEVVGDLFTVSDLSVAVVLWDGAATQRLVVKYNTSSGNLGYGTPNHFQQAWCVNRVEPYRNLFWMSDSSHAHKKGKGNLKKSFTIHDETRRMQMPGFIVDAIDECVPPLDRMRGFEGPGGDLDSDEPRALTKGSWHLYKPEWYDAWRMELLTERPRVRLQVVRHGTMHAGLHVAPDGKVKLALNFDRRSVSMQVITGQPHADIAYPISWDVLDSIQEWDQKTNGSLRTLPWLTRAHYSRESYAAG